MNVYLPGTGFATQGPCADGYHVPLKDEWEGVLNMMTGLGFTSLSDYVSKLHLPNASFRGSSDGNVSALTYGMYWTCNTGTSDGYGYCLQMRESYDTRILGSSVKTTGNSIRPFYNSYVEPDNTWTVIHGTLGSAGIFWNQTEGLISITSDGTTGYTISDKNLGATTVFNSGDTKSESNCGKFYQRGNNYGFPFAGSVTTSSTQVDASSYGPGNYYNSSTFILYANSKSDWSSVTNNNLRGGVDGNVNYMSELKNDYIGDYPHFTPGANTIGYYPLRVDFNDKSGNGYNLTVSNASITNLNGVPCGLYSSGRAYNATPTVGSTRTLVAWFIIQTSLDCVLVGTGAARNGYQAIMLANSGGTKIQISDYYASGYPSGTLTPTRHLGVAVASGSNMYLYVDGTLAASGTHSNTANSSGISAGGKAYIDVDTHYFTGYLSEVIIENKAWNATEVSNYYNLTKGNYGL